MRLDYKGTNFIPKSDESYGIIRFKTKDFAEALTPYGPAMGGNDLMKSPFTGHGFTKAKMEKSYLSLVLINMRNL